MACVRPSCTPAATERSRLLPTRTITPTKHLRAHKTDVDEGAGVTPAAHELRGLLRLAGPVIATTALEFLPGFTATALAGHLPSPLATAYVDAATLATMVANVSAYSVACGLSTALDTLATQAVGANRVDKLGVYLQSGLLIFSIGLGPVLVLNYYTGSVLHWLGQDTRVAELAQQFARSNLPGLPFVFLYELQRRVLQAQEMLAPLVAIALVSNLVHMVTGYWLAFHTSLGFIGIGLARSISNALLPVMVYVYLTWYGLTTRWWPRWDWRGAVVHVPVFLRLGVPGMLVLMMEWWAFESLSLLAGVLKHEDRVLAVSAHSVVLSVVSMAYMVFLGLSVAVNIRVGQYLGAHQPAQAQLAGFVGVGLVTALAGGIAGLIGVTRAWLPSLFVANAESNVYASRVLSVWAPFELCEGLNCVMQGVFRGAGRQDTAARINAAAYYLVGIPLACLFAFGWQGGVEGLWLGYGVGTVVSCVTLMRAMTKWQWVQLAHDAELRVADYRQ